MTKSENEILKLDLRSEDIGEARRKELLRVFPEIHTESGGIDFDALRKALGEHVDVGPERFGMSWPGKAECEKVIQRQSLATLLPLVDESVNWDATQNVIIEGDNLEVLKVLQKAYLGKVKMIYIDPPYNTGNDFIYPDNFTESLKTYLQYTGQVDAEGRKFSTNTEASGRFHSKWMNMMYPRLTLARDFLRDDGLILISIDDNEYANLKQLSDAIFGVQNHINTFVWVSNLKGRQISSNGAAATKEYVLAYAKDLNLIGNFRVSASRMKTLMPSVYRGFDYQVATDARGPYVVKNELYNTNSSFNEETRPNLVFDIYYDPSTEAVITEDRSDTHKHDGFIKISPHKNSNGTHQYHAFRWGRSKVESESFDLLFAESPSGWKVYTKIRDVDATALKDLLMDMSTSEGASDIKSVGLDPAYFDYPKPVNLIRVLLEACSDSDSIVMDFFAGSGTTAHAVMSQNSVDGGSRSFLLIQLPEPLVPDSSARLGGFETIADLTRARVSAAARVLAEERMKSLPDSLGEIDLGFRAFKLNQSNFAVWEADEIAGDQEKLEQQLLAQVEHVLPGRSSQDILFELMLKSRYELTTPISDELVDQCQVWKVAQGELVAVIDKGLTVEVIRQIASWQPISVLILDRCFAGDDSLKANARKIFGDAKIDLKTV